MKAHVGAAFATLLALGGCGDDAPPPPEDGVGTMVTTNAAAPAEMLDRVPVRFTGRWDASAAACAAPVAGAERVEVTADRLTLGTDGWRVVGASETGDGSVDVDAVAEESAITLQRRFRLAFAPGDAIAFTADGATARRVRCAPAASPSPSSGATAARADVLLTLTGDGLQAVVAESGSTRTLAFGSPAASAETLATTTRGPVTDRGRNAECGAGPLDFVEVAGLRLWMQDGRFVGWDAIGAGLTTMANVGIGRTRAEVEDVIGIDVSESTLGTEFSAGDLHGLLSGPGPRARVTALWAGTTCVFR